MAGLPAAIVAVVTTKPENVQGGGAPVFVTENAASLQAVSTSLEKIMDASAHEIDVHTMIIVAH